MNPIQLCSWSALPDREPTYALVAGVDLVIVRYDENVSVLYGRCLHRGALMSDGYVDGDNLMCGVHHWDYRLDTGVSEYNNHEVLHKFKAWIEEDQVLVDQDEIAAWAAKNPQPFQRDEYLGLYADPSHNELEEDKVKYIEKLAKGGVHGVGHHGPMSAMGVARAQLPSWDNIQILTAQLGKLPLMEDVPVHSEFVLGPRAKRPLCFDIPIFVSDMSFGALSEEAKLALAKGAESAGTGICSGEGGMLPEEQAAWQPIR